MLSAHRWMWRLRRPMRTYGKFAAWAVITGWTSAGVFGRRGIISNMSIYDRPHPGPLPQREGELRCATEKLWRSGCNLRCCSVQSGKHPSNREEHFVRDGRAILPLLGGEGGGEGDRSFTLFCAQGKVSWCPPSPLPSPP